MKTVSGSVVSSKPISLSKAASILNSFISAETGASHAVSAYLRRATDSFNELVQFHRELKVGRSERMHKKIRLEKIENENLTKAGTKPIQNGLDIDGNQIIGLVEEKSLRYSENFEEGVIDVAVSRSERKKKKTKIMKSEDWPEVEERERGGHADIEEEKREERKKRKKRKKVEMENEGLDDSEEGHGRKKKKKRRHEGES